MDGSFQYMPEFDGVVGFHLRLKILRRCRFTLGEIAFTSLAPIAGAEAFLAI